MVVRHADQIGMSVVRTLRAENSLALPFAAVIGLGYFSSTGADASSSATGIPYKSALPAGRSGPICVRTASLKIARSTRSSGVSVIAASWILAVATVPFVSHSYHWSNASFSVVKRKTPYLCPRQRLLVSGLDARARIHAVRRPSDGRNVLAGRSRKRFEIMGPPAPNSAASPLRHLSKVVVCGS